MIETIVVMRLFILSTIQGSWLVPQRTLPTPCMDGNSELGMVGDKYAAGLWIGFVSQQLLSQRAKKRLRFTNHSG